MNDVIRGRVNAQKIKSQIFSLLTTWGMPADTAETTAELMMQTDLIGIDSHGISMLPAYEEKLKAGTLNLAGRATVIKEGPSFALLDGQAGLGHPASAEGMRLAIKKARETGMGMVGVRNSHHFGAAGIYARMASDAGLLAFVTSSAKTLILVPTGASVPMLGTNPIAFAAPAQRNNDFVLDMATTTVAANKVKVYDYLNKPLPKGWAVNEHGQAVTDSAVAMDYIFKRPNGGLTPLGSAEHTSSHKGYGLAMMAQILGGTLTGSAFAALQSDQQKHDDVGHFFFVIDPEIFLPSGLFQSNLDDMIDAMHATPPAHPDGHVQVAGDPEALARADREANGIPISVALDTRIQSICHRAGANYLLFDTL